MIRFVGLDVHKRVVEACVLDHKGAIVLRHRFGLSREQLLCFAREVLQPEDRVVLEATTNTWGIVRLLKPSVAGVVVSNPLKTKAIAEARVKTDKVDAYVLAQLLRCDFLPTVWEPDEKTQQLRRLTRQRATLVAECTAIKNRIHAVLAERLLACPVKDLFCKAGRVWLQKLDLDDQGRLMVDTELRLLEATEREILSLDRRLGREGYCDGRVRLLMTMPGVNLAVAQTVIAALGDVRRFRDADHAASYLGLTPSTKQSADRCFHGPITKAGSGRARWMLVLAAQHLLKNPGPLGVFFRRLARRKNHNVAVVAAARKLIVVAWHMLTKNEPYRYADPRSTQAKLSRLRVCATGQSRKNGPRRGSPKVRHAVPGTRTRRIPSLPELYQKEGLSPPRPLPASEQSVLCEAGLLDYVESLGKPRVITRTVSQE
jgi:transposase